MRPVLDSLLPKLFFALLLPYLQLSAAAQVLSGRVLGPFESDSATESGGVCETDVVRVSAWRGERVHVRLFIRSGAAERVTLKSTPLVSSNGALDLGGDVRRRFVREVSGPRLRGEAACELPDILDQSSEWAFAAGEGRQAWFTFAVPYDARPGVYGGKISASITGDGCLSFPVELEVMAATLPRNEDRTFFLDIWQHPLTVARFEGVRPYSPEHYAALEPLYCELAQGGQKVLTAMITDYPWGEKWGIDVPRTMVDYVFHQDGTRTLDCRVLDEYVDFGRRCGIGPQIHCYSPLKFLKNDRYYYKDAETGETRIRNCSPGSKEYDDYWSVFLRLFERHAAEKGWLGDVYLAVDESDVAAVGHVAALLRENAPRLKFAVATNRSPLPYRGMKIESFSQILWRDFVPEEFLTLMLPERKANGFLTTFYVCNEPRVPNTWLSSAPEETEWMGLFAAAKGFSGILRWSAFHWSRDPWRIADDGSGNFAAGEFFLLYPRGVASTRWERLRDAVEDAEKIILLRRAGKSSVELERALADLSFDRVRDGEPCLKGVKRVLDLLERDARNIGGENGQ